MNILFSIDIPPRWGCLSGDVPLKTSPSVTLDSHRQPAQSAIQANTLKSA